MLEHEVFAGRAELLFMDPAVVSCMMNQCDGEQRERRARSVLLPQYRLRSRTSATTVVILYLIVAWRTLQTLSTQSIMCHRLCFWRAAPEASRLLELEYGKDFSDKNRVHTEDAPSNWYTSARSTSRKLEFPFPVAPDSHVPELAHS